jgi:TnpA family transposase
MSKACKEESYRQRLHLFKKYTERLKTAAYAVLDNPSKENRTELDKILGEKP